VLRDAITGPTAQIIVGSSAGIKTFSIHKKLLCDSSTYFKAALNNGFAETKEQTINLDDEDPAIFRTFALWLYEGELNKKTLPHEKVSGKLVKHLFNLYVFADKRGIGNLANDTITMLASYWIYNIIDLTEVECEVLVVLRNSKLYELVLDNLTLELRDNHMDCDLLAASDLPKDFLIDLLRQTSQLCETFIGNFKCLQAVCHYHCHNGQGIMGKEECIRNTEAGRSTYYKHVKLKQVDWEGDDWGATNK
jgi:hypothetical protein